MERQMPSDRPNVLFLLSDEHSYRYFSYLDPDGEGEPVRTPALDSIATKSTNFRQTYCSMPLCTPSRMCMLTGLEQRHAGAWENGSWLKPELPTLPGTLADAGYETCLMGKMHFGGNRQFNGFQHRPYGDITGTAGHQADPLTPRSDVKEPILTRTANSGLTEWPESRLQEQIIVRESMTWLREQEHTSPDQPWFLCASFSRPHFPLTAPRRHLDKYWPEGVTRPKMGPGDTHEHPMTRGMRAGFKTDKIGEEDFMRSRATYFACVDYLDEILGDFLAMLDRDGLLDNTIVVYTTDHGELAGEHGLWWKNSWHDGAARVPYFIQTPEHREGTTAPRSVETPASLVDLYPTLCGLCGVESPDNVDGLDLSRVVRGSAEPDRDPIVCDALYPRWGEGTEFRMVRDGRWKYVAFRDAAPILIDLENDPHEQHNLAGASDASPEAVAAQQRLAAYVAETMDFDAAAEEMARDEITLAENRLTIPHGTANSYILPDGRLIDADRGIYKPSVLADNASSAFQDYPV
jgi:choline-sulfatase